MVKMRVYGGLTVFYTSLSVFGFGILQKSLQILR